MKRLEDLTLVELQNLVNDLHALMWAGDGCEICAHCEIVHREPYYKTRCKLERGRLECKPLWRGFVGELETPREPGF
jgi:hypothetical protein